MKVHRWLPNLKVFDLIKKIRETPTDPAAGAAAEAAGVVAKSGHHRQGTTAGLGFLGEGAGSLFPPLFSPESMANRILPSK